MPISRIAKNVKPSPTFVINSKAKAMQAAGQEVLNLSVGEPDFPTPEIICKAAEEALAQGWTRYTPVAGTPDLRERISLFLKESKGLDYPAEQIVVSTGAKQSLYNAFSTLIDPGDEVIIPTPCWVSYEAQVELLGGKVVFVPTKSEDHFQIDPEALENAVTPATKMILINSPNNPTGAVYTSEVMEAIAEIVEKHKLWLVCDDIYDQLVYGDAKAISPLQLVPSLAKRTVMINGFSKAYAMTGWRLGYLAAPKEIVKASIAIQGSLTSGANTIAQRAAIAALSMPSSIVEGMRKTFEGRLQVILQELNKIPGVQCPIPQGAFYVLPDFKAFVGRTTPSGQIIKNTLELSEYLLQNALVATVPGEAFNFPGHIRFAYANSIPTIQKAISQVADALARLQ